MAVIAEEVLAPVRGARIRTDAVDVGDEADVLRRRLLRLSFDVHDGPMQDLIAMAQRMHGLRDRASASSDLELREAVVLELTDLVVRAGETEAMLRSLMFELEHSGDTDADASSIVAEHVEAFERHTKASVDVAVGGDLELFTDSQRIALARILRESLSNIARHANASTVTVTVAGTEKALRIEVEDDGCGFCPDATASDGRRHIGLTAMRERLALLGGTLTIDSRPEQGTRVTAEIKKWRPPTAANS